MDGVVVQDLVVDLVGEDHQAVAACQVEDALHDLLRVHRSGGVVGVDDDHGLGAVGDLRRHVGQVGVPLGLLVAHVVDRLAAGQGRHRRPEREVRRRDQDLVTVLDERLHGHGHQLRDAVAEEHVVDAHLQAEALVALGDRTAGREDATGVRVAVRLREHPDHVLEDLLGRLEAEQRGVAGVQAQHAVARLLQCVGVLDHRAADLVTDLAELVRLPELHCAPPETRVAWFYQVRAWKVQQPV